MFLSFESAWAFGNSEIAFCDWIGRSGNLISQISICEGTQFQLIHSHVLWHHAFLAAHPLNILNYTMEYIQFIDKCTRIF